MGVTITNLDWFLQPHVFNNVVQFMAGLMVESLLYGIHLILFCIAAYKLCPQQWGPRVILFVFVVIMICLASLDTALSFWFVLHDIPRIRWCPPCFDQAIQHLLIKNFLFVVNNLFADSLLIYRFFVIWGKRKSIVIIPVLLLSSETASGFFIQAKFGPGLATAGINTLTPGYLWCVFGLNTSLTVLTATRIWWLSRNAVSAARTKRFAMIAAVIIETGAVYSIILLCVAVIPFDNGWHFYFIALLNRFVGIMPTLMIVQVEWGRDSPSSGTSSDPSSTVVVSTVPMTYV